MLDRALMAAMSASIVWLMVGCPPDEDDDDPMTGLDASAEEDGGSGPDDSSTSSDAGPTRPAGPHSDEVGEVSYWVATSSTTTAHQCSDAPPWPDVIDNLSEAFPVGSYFIYRVEVGLESATAQVCTTTEASSCTDSGQVYEIDGHEFTYQSPPAIIDDSDDCNVYLYETRVFRDNGSIGGFTYTATFGYEDTSTACLTKEASFQASAENGYGLADCQITIMQDYDFSHVD